MVELYLAEMVGLEGPVASSVHYWLATAPVCASIPLIEEVSGADRPLLQAVWILLGPWVLLEAPCSLTVDRWKMYGSHPPYSLPFSLGFWNSCSVLNKGQPHDPSRNGA